MPNGDFIFGQKKIIDLNFVNGGFRHSEIAIAEAIAHIETASLNQDKSVKFAAGRGFSVAALELMQMQAKSTIAANPLDSKYLRRDKFEYAISVSFPLFCYEVTRYLFWQYIFKLERKQIFSTIPKKGSGKPKRWAGIRGANVVIRSSIVAPRCP